jgi:hypothetical protein
METLFELYDRWHGLLTIVCGAYASLLAYGYLPRKPKDPVRLEVWRRRFGPTMKLLSPLIILFGTVTLVSALLTDDSIAAKVQELNRIAPKMVDKVTRFDRATSGPGQLITFDHTVMNITADQVSLELWAKYTKELRRNLATAETRRLQHKKVTLIYRYYDVKGLLIGELEIAPDYPIPN